MMNTEIYAPNQNDLHPHVVVRGKRYLFLTSHDDEMATGYDGYIFPYLCTYIFADNQRQPIAIIMFHSRKEPELMDVNWNGKNKMPMIHPEFTRESRLGIPSGINMPDLALTMLKSCRQVHQLWSSQFAEKQPFFDSIRRSVTVFNKTYFITKGGDIPKGMDGAVYHDPIEGFIFIDTNSQPVFALTECANERYFCSAADVDGRVVSMFALEDADVGKLGGELLLDIHRSQVARRLFSVLAGELGVVA
ncbi:hypothetical protein [Klebsiella sp. HN106]|uniref:hypothetical protein n=1 Tax=Klebsiella sp. HN106 TaxID=3401058 RepID=UPI003EC02F0C